MRSTARGWCFPLVDYAKALEAHIPGAEAFRKQGFQAAMNDSLAAAVAYCDTIKDTSLRAFAVIGVAESLGRNHK